MITTGRSIAWTDFQRRRESRIGVVGSFVVLMYMGAKNSFAHLAHARQHGQCGDGRGAQAEDSGSRRMKPRASLHLALPLLCGILSAAPCMAQTSAVPVPTSIPPGVRLPCSSPPCSLSRPRRLRSPRRRAAPRPSGPLLNDLEKMLNTGATPLKVNIVFPDGDEITESHLIRGAAVAQAIALRAGIVRCSSATAGSRRTMRST